MVEKPKFLGIDKNWIVDAIIGAFVALSFIFLSSLTPLIGTIALPNLPQALGLSDIAKFLIICLVAPIQEETFFRFFLNGFFTVKLKLPFIVSALISSSLFSLFHLSAYGSSLASMSGSFISAFLVGMAFSYLSKITNSNAGNIIAHGILNFYIARFIIVG